MFHKKEVCPVESAIRLDIHCIKCHSRLDMPRYGLGGPSSIFLGTWRMLCLWYTELEIPYRHFSQKSLSGKTGNMPPSGVGHGFTKGNTKREEGRMKPKTRFSSAQGDEIQKFHIVRGESWRFVAGRCLRNFMEQRQLQNEPFTVTGKWDSEFQHAAILQCTVFCHRKEEVWP